MRTTFTVDPDLSSRIDRLRRERGISMARVVNELIRAGLDAPPKKRRRYRMKHAFGSKLLIRNLDDAMEVIEQLEGPGHR
jgi:Ribbon-helix-helix protein, copG family